MYVFDCALMKYPNTGLFAFSDNLARCLARHAEEQKEKMGFYVPEKYIGRWGSGVSYMKLSALHKIYLPARGIDVWHAAYQRSRYLPPKGTRMVLTVHDLNLTDAIPMAAPAMTYVAQCLLLMILDMPTREAAA